MSSVVCPIYHEEKYIETCIKSIVLQDYPKDDLEILFVDGMSNDTTRAIVVEYSKIYPYIKLCSVECYEYWYSCCPWRDYHAT